MAGLKFLIGSFIILAAFMVVELIIFESTMKGPVYIEPRATAAEAKALERIEIYGLLGVLTLICIFTWR